MFFIDEIEKGDFEKRTKIQERALWNKWIQWSQKDF